MVPLSPSERISYTETPPSLLTLTYELLLAIFSLLRVDDILRIRPTCKSLHKATKDKLLWICLLRNLVIEDHIPLPRYLPPTTALAVEQLEAFTRRAELLSNDWKHGVMMPRTVIRPDLPRSVTWLRLVCSRWLLVASYDTHASTLSCWDVSKLFQNSNELAAECFFSGPVMSGEVQIQADGIVIALAVSSCSPAIEVFSLRRREDAIVFVKLADLPGFTHVKLLSGDLIGCLMKDGISIPQLIDWRTQDSYALADVPDVNGAALAMTIWTNFLVIVGAHEIRIFTLPLSPAQSPDHLETLPFGHSVWEAIFLHPSALAGSVQQICPEFSKSLVADGLNLLIFFESKIHIYVLDYGIPSTAGEDVTGGFMLQLTALFDWRHEWDKTSWSFHVGATGRRIMWLSEGHNIGGDAKQPTIFASTLSRDAYSKHDASHDFFGQVLDISDVDRLPATWAMPQYDFDEATGIFVIGNTFGELAICDCANLPLEPLKKLADDFTDRDTEDLDIASTSVTMQIPSIGYLLCREDVADEAAHIGLSRSPIGIVAEDLPEGWTNRWSHFPRLSQWQGFPGDKAWTIEHCWNFLGQPQLLLYSRHNTGSTIFRAGGLYFLLVEYDLYVCNADITIADILDALRQHRINDILSNDPFDFNWVAQSQGDHCISFAAIELEELEHNRRDEQVERGGCPHSSMFRKTNGKWTFVNPDYQKYAKDEPHPSDDESEDSSEESTNGDEDDGSEDGREDDSEESVEDDVPKRHKDDEAHSSDKKIFHASYDGDSNDNEGDGEGEDEREDEDENSIEESAVGEGVDDGPRRHKGDEAGSSDSKSVNATNKDSRSNEDDGEGEDEHDDEGEIRSKERADGEDGNS